MTIVTPDVQERVGQFLGYFEPRPSEHRPSQLSQDDETSWPSRLMLSPENVICLANFFYPELPSPSIYTSSPCITNPSTASSLSGSSTLTYRSLDFGSTVASSLTPSVSGTIATSNTIIGESSTEGSPVRDTQSPFLPLEDLGLTSTVDDSKGNLSHRMKVIRKNLTETFVSEKDPADHHSAEGWAFVYITKNGKRLHMDHRNSDSKLPETNSLVDESPTPNGIHRHDVQALKEAIRGLIVHHNASRDLVSDVDVIARQSCDMQILLKNRFESAMFDCNAQFEFANALFWWKAIQLLQRLSSDQHHPEYLDTLLREIANDLKASINLVTKTTKRDQAWCHFLANLQSAQRQELYKLENTRKTLRIKMWYVSDVRHSAPYEDALYVTRALRAMASSSRIKQPGSITNWARNRLRHSIGQDRLEAQTLDALVAHRDHGGLSKLGDEQVELTSRWLTKNSIENFCKGEERIHRFCFEIQKCVNKLAGMSLLDSPVLWSSRLFGREKSAFDARFSATRNYGSTHNRSLNAHVNTSNYNRFLSPQLSYLPIDPPSSYGFKHDNSNNHCSRVWSLPKLSMESSGKVSAPKAKFNNPSTIASLQSPLITQKSMGPSGDYGSYTNIPEEVVYAKRTFTHQIKKILYSLLLSDLGYLLWIQGSETDVWMKCQQVNETIPPSEPQHFLYVPPAVAAETQRGHKKTDSNDSVQDFDKSENRPENTTQERDESELSSTRQRETSQSKDISNTPAAPIYTRSPLNGTRGPRTDSPHPYSKAFRNLLERLSFVSDPYMKLQILSELEVLVLNFMHDFPNTQIMTELQTSGSSSSSYSAGSNPIHGRHTNIPRTKATSLEEVIANCTERRAGTLTLGVSKGNVMKILSDGITPEIPNTDSIINALLAIFRDPCLRPHTLYRDLQLIAAFIPPTILDQTPLGKAFWDAGLAALALKEDVCASMINRATQITTYHISTSKPTLPNPGQNLANSTLRDAAHLWLLTAKEGSPLAARELGLFYLTHPELLPRVTLPLSKAKDVFRSIASGDHRGGGVGGGGGGGGTGSGVGATRGLNTLTFAVVFHWMELAANGGDRDARDFLRENGELSGGR